jgi:hypothetical protein
MIKEVKEKWDNMADSTVSKLEQRMWAIVIGLALTFGGIWLQNQYATTLKLQEQLAEYMQFVDDKYVEQNSFEQHTSVLDRRLDRMENKLDSIIEKNIKLEHDRSSVGP